MIINIRCWSCGKPIAHLWAQFKQRIAKGETRKKVMDELGLDRYCCRAMFLGNVEMQELVGRYR